jgi:hypothetical protein
VYTFLADLLVLVHFAFIVFVIAGGLLVLRWPVLAWIHVPAAVWGALIEFQRWICPLTPLENQLRELAGERSYSGDFIEHYLLAIMYPEGLTADLQMILGSIVVLVNLLIYAAVWRRRNRRPGA